jgi:hypothetical protein
MPRPRFSQELGLRLAFLILATLYTLFRVPRMRRSLVGEFLLSRQSVPWASDLPKAASPINRRASRRRRQR